MFELRCCNIHRCLLGSMCSSVKFLHAPTCSDASGFLSVSISRSPHLTPALHLVAATGPQGRQVQHVLTTAADLLELEPQHDSSKLKTLNWRKQSPFVSLADQTEAAGQQGKRRARADVTSSPYVPPPLETPRKNHSGKTYQSEGGQLLIPECLARMTRTIVLL
jgi:hypothetical protein